jgi:hypothetical protein
MLGRAMENFKERLQEFLLSYFGGHFLQLFSGGSHYRSTTVGRHFLLSFRLVTSYSSYFCPTLSFSTWPHIWAPLITDLPGGGFTLPCL